MKKMVLPVNKLLQLYKLLIKQLKSFSLSFHIVFLALSALYLILISPYIITQFEVYNIGDTADKDLASPISFRVEDIEREKLALEVTQLRSKRYYTWSRRQAFEIISFIEGSFNIAAETAEMTDMQIPERINHLKKQIQDEYDLEIEESAARYLLRNAANHNVISTLRSQVIDLFFHNAVVGSLQEKHIAENDLRNNIMSVIEFETGEEIRPPRSFYTLNEALEKYRRILVERGAVSLYPTFENIFSPNIYYDARLTHQKTEEILGEIGSHRYWVGRGELIVRVGDRISEQDHQVLSRLDEIIQQRRPFLNLGYFLFICFNLGIQLILLRFFVPDFKITIKNLFLSSLATIFVIIIGRFFILAFPSWGKYLIMAPLATLLNFTILGKTAAFILAVNGSFYYAMMSHGSFQVFAITLFSSLIIILFSRRIHERKDLLLAGLASGTTFGLTIILLDYLDTPTRIRLSYGLLGIINGLLSGSLTLVICPVFEQLFRMSTFMRLLEITNPQYELLSQLKKRAYGTFEHSMEVAQLIENLQDHFPIDILLMKAGALYHDIGKIHTPNHFTENQKQDEENPHDKLEPYESAHIIKEHVRHSIHIAEKYKLPDTVIDFIREHHGTTRLEIFYQKAISQNPHGIVNEKEFRYNGPKPQSLETGILHIADAVSAAMKSLQEVNAEIIDNLVSKIINERLEDGQFDECPLTFRQLTILRREIIRFYNQKYLKKRVNYVEEHEKISSRNK